MPTDARKDLLYRDFAVVSARDIAEPACALLREVINDATWVHRRCEADSRMILDEEDVHLPAFMLYYQIIEMADACEVLISRACVDPTIPLIRVMFEAVLQLEFILQDENEYRRRSLCWIVCHVRNQIRNKQAFLPKTRRGRRFSRTLAEGVLRDFTIPSFAASLAGEVEGYRKLLRTKRYKDIDKEYRRRAQKRRAKKTYTVIPYSYSLFGGPANLRMLARELEQEALYDYFYDSWSAVSHATDASRYITSKDDKAAFFSLRNSERVQENADFVYIFLTWARRIMLNKFRREEPVSKRWFEEDVKPLRDKLDRIRLVRRKAKLDELTEQEAARRRKRR